MFKLYTRCIFAGIIVISLFVGCAKPVAKFLVTEQRYQAPATIEFINNSEKAESFFWHFGDGDTSSVDSPKHRYKLSGKYEVTLEARDGNKKSTREQILVIDPPESCLIEISTKYGNMLVELSDQTPLHRDNFVKLVEQGFYDSLLFHRVIEGFMIQGGDPLSKKSGSQTQIGSGGPGFLIDAEIREELIHVKGALAAARTGDRVNPERKSSGSQFYIVQGGKVSAEMLENIQNRKGVEYNESLKNQYLENGGYPPLDYDYTVFGIVIEGLNVIDSIAQVQTNRVDRPIEDVIMKIQLIK